jgi:hypothetical protein
VVHAVQLDQKGMMMPASPWILSTRVELTGDYLVLVSEFPLRQYSSTPAFMRMVLQVRKQLADAWVSSDGLQVVSESVRGKRRENVT